MQNEIQSKKILRRAKATIASNFALSVRGKASSRRKAFAGTSLFKLVKLFKEFPFRSLKFLQICKKKARSAASSLEIFNFEISVSLLLFGQIVALVGV